MYEVFLDDKNNVIETGNILYANLNLVVKITLYIILTQKK